MEWRSPLGAIRNQSRPAPAGAPITLVQAILEAHGPQDHVGLCPPAVTLSSAPQRSKDNRGVGQKGWRR
jgi:hypothetical protein